MDTITDYPPPSSAALAAAAGERASHARATATRAFDMATSTAADLRGLREQVAAIVNTLGHAPAPGRQGAGLVGAVVHLEELVQELVREQRRRAPPPSPPPRARLARSSAVIAIVAALGGGGGIAGLVHALRGSSPPVVQTNGAPPAP